MVEFRIVVFPMEATDLVFRENHTGKHAAGLEAWIGFCVDQSVHADRSIPLGPVDKREDGTVAADADGHAVVVIGPVYRTVWYEIAVRGR